MDGEPPDPAVLDAETGAHGHKDELRLWLRLLTCTTMTETLIRGQLRERFGVTLPRFDLLAQLARSDQGMTLGDLSRRMMVTNGNVTGLVERLVSDGLVARTPRPTDRRTVTVCLTEVGRREFPGDGGRARALGGGRVRGRVGRGCGAADGASRPVEGFGARRRLEPGFNH